MSARRAAPFKKWTEAERKLLLTLAAEDRNWNSIARSLPGRTVTACKVQHNIMLREAQGLFRVRDVKPRKVNGRISRTADDIRLMTSPPASPPDHTSITAAVFGDPRPGRSALDRRMSSP